MGFRKFCERHALAQASQDAAGELAEKDEKYRRRASHEHRKHIQADVDAKVAIAEANCKIAFTEANSKIALAEAEARGLARGGDMGYQRAINETELFDAAFQDGNRSRRLRVERKRPLGVERQIEAPPARTNGGQSDHSDQLFNQPGSPGSGHGPSTGPVQGPEV